MKTVNIHEAKTHLSRLIEEVTAGKEVTVARNGKPVARLVPVSARTTPRRPGQWRGPFPSATTSMPPSHQLSGGLRSRSVNLLLDAPVLLWWLGDTARNAIADPQTRIWVSSASAWEISIKWSLGRSFIPPARTSSVENRDVDVRSQPSTIVREVATCCGSVSTLSPMKARSRAG